MPFLRAGIYEPVSVLTSRMGKSKNKGTDYLEVTFSDGADGIAVWTGWFSEKAWSQTEKVLKTLGWDPDANGFRFDLLNGTSVLADLGVQCQIDVRDEAYTRADGSTGTISKVRWVNPLGSTGRGEAEPMDASEATAAAARIRASILASRGPGKTAPPAAKGAPAKAPPRAPAKGKAATPPAAPASDDATKAFDDDIPF